jgi:lysophospholipase L1-like esterase
MRATPRTPWLTSLLIPLAALVMGGCGSAAKPKTAKTSHKPAAHGSATSAGLVAGSRYLAMGDSYTFGYLEYQVIPHPNYSRPSSFIGYPEQLGRELHLKVANASCPGETSASLISVSAQSNGCENSLWNRHNGYRLVHPLHVRYGGSQLAYAVSYLNAHRDVRLVSLMIGLNDWLFCRKSTKDLCASTAEWNGILQKLTGDIHRILSAIRTQGHYRGQLVIANYPSPLIAYNSKVAALNGAIDAAASPFGVVVADGFGAFQAADRHSSGSPCAAGLVTRFGRHGRCGIHPSYTGQAVLAQAIEKALQL